MTKSGTTNAFEWQRVVQQVTMSGTASDNEWQRLAKNGNQWQRVTNRINTKESK